MKEFIDKLISRLEEREAELKTITAECKPTKEIKDKNYGYYTAMNHAKEIVNQLAEEYNNGSVKGDLISRSALKEAIRKSTCNWTEHLWKQVVCDVIDNQPTACNDGWIPCEEQLPPHSDDLLLIQCNGKPRNNISLVNAFCLASYTEEGWILEMYPDWKDADVVAWKDLGAPYQPKGE